ncbi:helix-turn-helix domain-containing protein [Paenibacillus ferrarius]|uniref:helix-turn-helix domain-containing protein n=1 Tax=Paenibacillus ferrarius TaxID=1469647 RepID=UPI003D2D4A76
MSIRRRSFVMLEDSFFHPGVPIYVNRAYESFESSEHSHEFIEITYVSEGAGVHYIDDEAVPALHGTLFFIPVGCRHVFRPKTPEKDRPLIVYNCLIRTAYLTELGNGFPQASGICGIFADSSLHWFTMNDSSGEYQAMFRELYREFSTKPPGYLAVLTSLIIRILTGLYRHRLQIDAPAVEKPLWLTLEEAISYVDRHYSTDIRLGELAARSNLSERQFRRLFKSQTGMSFTDYLQSIRIEAACKLLIGSRSSVSEVAASVGYADMKFFHKLFKKKTGITPGQFRNRKHEDPALK